MYSIIMYCRSGDADLYVSERIAKPDYEPDKYDLHSASCGLDIVSIPGRYIPLTEENTK